MMQWNTKLFEQLCSLEVYKILQLRNEVFVVEQQTYYQDADDKDFAAIHLYLEIDDRIVAYCRLMPQNINYAECSIGRVVTHPQYRQKGYGKILVQKAIDFINREWKQSQIRISAQCYLQHFYESYGFRQVSDIYLEDNLPHIEMLKP